MRRPARRRSREDHETPPRSVVWKRGTTATLCRFCRTSRDEPCTRRVQLVLTNCPRKGSPTGQVVTARRFWAAGFGLMRGFLIDEPSFPLLCPQRQTSPWGRAAGWPPVKMLDAICRIARTWGPWRDLPAEPRNWTSVFRLCREWSTSAWWDAIREALADGGGNPDLLKRNKGGAASALSSAPGPRRWTSRAGKPPARRNVQLRWLTGAE